MSNVPAWVPDEFHSAYQSAALLLGEEAAASIAREAKKVGRWPKRRTWNRRTHTLTRERRMEMIAAYMAGEQSSSIAHRFNVHPAYVRVAAQRAGFRRKATKGVVA